MIDIGNTRIKAATFKDDALIDMFFFDTTKELLGAKELLASCQRAIIGSVVDDVEGLAKQLKAIIPTQVFETSTGIPIKNNYQSSATLGSDRLAASIGAYRLYPNSNVLVIDTGTCIKYNFTNYNNEYLGGGISPGMQMRFKALHQYTSKLPLIVQPLEVINLIGTTTEQSILSGVVNGAVAEIDGIIEAYKQQFQSLVCVMTGGDSEYLCKQLKNSIFANQNLVLKGLNDILNYNLENK